MLKVNKIKMDLLLNEEQEYGLIILSSKSGQSGIANHIMHPETIKKYYLININEIKPTSDFNPILIIHYSDERETDETRTCNVHRHRKQRRI